MGWFSVDVDFQVYRMGSSRALLCHNVYMADSTVLHT